MRTNGFTLIELMIALSVFAIIITTAVPSMSSFLDKKTVVAAAEDLYGNLQMARSEAITRSNTVFSRFNVSGPNWQYGVSTNTACNLAKTNPAESGANACVLVVDDGDGVIDDGTASIDSADTVLHRYTSLDYNDVSLALTVAPTANQINFSSTRGTANAATITLQSDGGYQMRVIVGVLGQIRLCSPAGSGFVGGYSSDGC